MKITAKKNTQTNQVEVKIRVKPARKPIKKELQEIKISSGNLELSTRNGNFYLNNMLSTQNCFVIGCDDIQFLLNILENKDAIDDYIVRYYKSFNSIPDKEIF